MDWAVLCIQNYLECTHFKIHTEHDSIHYVMDLSTQIGRLQRWCLSLMENDFEVLQCPRSLPQEPAALSTFQEQIWYIPNELSPQSAV